MEISAGNIFEQMTQIINENISEEEKFQKVKTFYNSFDNSDEGRRAKGLIFDKFTAHKQFLWQENKITNVRCERARERDIIDFEEDDKYIIVNAHESGQVIRARFDKSKFKKMAKFSNVATEHGNRIHGETLFTGRRINMFSNSFVTTKQSTSLRIVTNTTLLGANKHIIVIDSPHDNASFSFRNDSEVPNNFFKFVDNILTKGAKRQTEHLLTVNCIEEEEDSLTLCKSNEDIMFLLQIEKESQQIYVTREEAIKIADNILNYK